MSDGGGSWLPTAVGVVVFIVMRLLDYFVPRGFMSEWTARHSRRVRPPRDEQDDT